MIVLSALAVMAVAATEPAVLTAEQEKELAFALEVAGPRPADYERKMRVYLEDTLKDAETARFKDLRAPKLIARKASRKAPDSWGWETCIAVNAKNSYGGYVGYQSYVFRFQLGEIVSVSTNADWRYRDTVDEACAMPATTDPRATGITEEAAKPKPADSGKISL